jgi:hypothetical protein
MVLLYPFSNPVIAECCDASVRSLGTVLPNLCPSVMPGQALPEKNSMSTVLALPLTARSMVPAAQNPGLPAAPGSTAPGSTRPRDPVADFKKGIKRDPSQFPILKEDKRSGIIGTVLPQCPMLKVELKILQRYRIRGIRRSLPGI